MSERRISAWKMGYGRGNGGSENEMLAFVKEKFTGRRAYNLE